MYFAWITGLRGPEGQIWQSEPVDGNGKPRTEVIFKTKLSHGEQHQDLAYLKMKYAHKVK